MPKRFNRLVGAELGFNMKPFQFFVDLSKAIIRQRQTEKDNKIKRTDLVQLMLDAFIYEDELQEKNYDKLTATADNDEHLEVDKKSNTAEGSIRRQLSENEIVAQCILFFVAGFETTATTLSNALYQLAIHPEKQSILAEELRQALDGVEVDSAEYFDKVNNHIPYLEATIKETLRKYPPLSVVGRVCEADNYKLGPATLPKGALINVMINAIHLNPEYYPNPHQFNPDRFMPENKHQLVPYTYLPFSIGPRNCIAMRFAYQELRLCIASIVRKFKFEVTPDTPKELKFKSASVLMMAEPFSIRVTKR